MILSLNLLSLKINDSEEIRGSNVTNIATVNMDKIRAIWKDLLDEEVINDNDDFFDLGGHSLLSMKMRSQIEALYSTSISDSEFYDNPTISGLCVLIISKQDSELDVGDILVKIWAKLLDADRIGPKDDFFDLGGHSLLLMKMKALVEAKCGVSIGDMEINDNTEFSALQQLVIRKLKTSTNQ